MWVATLKVISWKSKLFFTEIVVQLNDKTQFHMVKVTINAFAHMEFCFGHESDNGQLLGHPCLLPAMLVLLLPFIPGSK